MQVMSSELSRTSFARSGSLTSPTYTIPTQIRNSTMPPTSAETLVDLEPDLGATPQIIQRDGNTVTFHVVVSSAHAISPTLVRSVISRVDSRVYLAVGTTFAT